MHRSTRYSALQVRPRRRRCQRTTETQYSLHKVDTLITALKVFRAGPVEEFAEYDRRKRELDELSGE